MQGALLLVTPWYAEDDMQVGTHPGDAQGNHASAGRLNAGNYMSTPVASYRTTDDDANP